MGNSSYSISNLAEDVVVNNKVTFDLKLNAPKNGKGYSSASVTCTGPKKASVAVNSSETKGQDGSVSYKLDFTPSAAGTYRIAFQMKQVEEGKDDVKINQAITAYADASGVAAAVARKAEAKAAEAKAKKDAEAEEKVLLAQRAEGGGYFQTTRKFSSLEQLAGKTLRVCGADAKTGLNVWIDNQPYTVAVASVSPDAEANAEIQAKVASYPSFPSEEKKFPNIDYDKKAPLLAILKNACKITCPATIKQCLARGADVNADFGFNATPLSIVLEAGTLSKNPAEWRTFSRSLSSRIDSVSPAFSNRRNSTEADAVACLAILLSAGARFTKKVLEVADKDNWMAKGVDKTRFKRALQAFNSGFAEEVSDWPSFVNALDDLSAEWPPAGPIKLDSGAESPAPVAYPAGWIFDTTTPRVRAGSDIKSGTAIELRGLVAGTKDTFKCVIEHENCLVKLEKLSFDEAKMAAIVKKRDAFSSFPYEEKNLPKKAWPLHVTLDEVLKGACSMLCPRSLKNALAWGADPNADFGFGETPLSKVAGGNPAKKPAEWQTQFGISSNFATTKAEPSFRTYRQSKESCSVACAIILLEAGAKFTAKVDKNVNKESFFAKGIKRVRMLKVFELMKANNNKVDWKIEWPKLGPLAGGPAAIAAAAATSTTTAAARADKKTVVSKASPVSAPADSGYFITTPRYKTAASIPANVSIDVGTERKGDVVSVVIQGQSYTIRLSDLTFDAKKAAEIKANLAKFTAFPTCESRRPKKPYPLNATLDQVFKAACECNDVFAVRQALARGADPNMDFGWNKTPLSKVSEGGPAKKAEEWRTEHGVSRNTSFETPSGKWQTYRQAREADSVACAILLLQAGAKITAEVTKAANKESFFAKGVKRARLLRVLDEFPKNPKIDWAVAFQKLDDINAKLA